MKTKDLKLDDEIPVLPIKPTGKILADHGWVDPSQFSVGTAQAQAQAGGYFIVDDNDDNFMLEDNE